MTPIAISRTVLEFSDLLVGLQGTDIIVKMIRNAISLKTHNYHDHSFESYKARTIYPFLFDNCSGLWAISLSTCLENSHSFSVLKIYFENTSDMMMTKLRFENEKF